MADEDNDQKTEFPTGKRLDEARERGQMAISRETATWFVFLGMLVTVKWLVPPMVEKMLGALRVFIEMPDAIAVDDRSMQNTISTMLTHVGTATAFVFIAMLVAGVAGYMSQTGFFASFETIVPDPSRLNPMNGAKRLFSMTALVELAKSFGKLVVLGGAVALTLLPVIGEAPTFSSRSMSDVLMYLHLKAVHLIIVLLLIFSVIALSDLLYQRYAYIKGLKMTKQEVKDEFKQQEGDPQIKGRLRQIRMEKARKRMMSQVPKADVIITNPTHYAIALKYDNKEMTAPMVIAKGINLVADRIRALAEENRIPLVSNPTLARTLYDTVDIDREIPTQYYRAVAEVISYVYKLKKRKF